MKEMGVAEEEGMYRGALVGVLTGVVFGLAGFGLAQMPATKSMGAVMFMLVPFAAGVGIAMVTPAGGALKAATGLSILALLTFLVSLRKEGLLCALLAFPVLLVALCTGVALGVLVRSITDRFTKSEATLRSVVLLLMPLLVYGGRRVEVATLTHVREEIVTSTIYLPAEPERVWGSIHSLESVAGKKQF